MKIPLGKSGKFTLVDKDDFRRVSSFPWHLDSKGYAVYSAGKERIWIFLHQFILGRSLNKKYIDHINGNPLDNRKMNLRFVSGRENSLNRKVARNNTSGYTGVGLDGNKWRCTTWNQGKHISLGSFKTKQEAINARKRFEKNSGHIFRGKNAA